MSVSKLLSSEALTGSGSKWRLTLALVGGAALAGGAYYLYARRQLERPMEQEEAGGDTASTISTLDDEDTPRSIMKRLNAKGSDLFRKRKYEEAIAEYTKAVEASPGDEETKVDLSTIFQNRAAAYENVEQLDKVIADCSEAIKLNPRYTKALLRRAKVAEKQDKLIMALEDLTAVCIIECFRNSKTLQTVDVLLKKIGKMRAKERFGKDKAPTPTKNYVDSFLRGFYCDPVINFINSSSPIEPADEASKGYLYAVKALRDAKYEEVIESCSREIENEDSKLHSEARLLRAIMNILYINKDAAMADLQAIVDSDKSSNTIKATALVKMGSLEVAFSSDDKAKEYFEKAESEDPQNSDAYHQRGQMFLVGGQMEEAYANFLKSVSLSPEFAVGYIQKLHVDYRRHTFAQQPQEVAKVLAEFKEWALKYPDCIEIKLILGQILMEEEQFDEVDKMFSSARSAQELTYRGMLLIHWKKDIPGAVACINQALQADPKCDMALEHLATINVQSGKLERGVELLDRVIPLSKTQSEMAHYFSLRDAAAAQITVIERLGIALPNNHVPGM